MNAFWALKIFSLPFAGLSIVVLWHFEGVSAPVWWLILTALQESFGQSGPGFQEGHKVCRFIFFFQIG